MCVIGRKVGQKLSHPDYCVHVQRSSPTY